MTEDDTLVRSLRASERLDDWSHGVLRWFQTVAPLALVASVLLPLLEPGGTLTPWVPRTPGLEAMRAHAFTLLHNGAVIEPGTIHRLPHSSVGLLVTSVFALSNLTVWQVLVSVASVWALQSTLRLTLKVEGWTLTVVGLAVLVLVEPVRSTLATGQLSLVLVWLVVADLLRPSSRRVLPRGALTGLVAAAALSPVWLLVGLLAAGLRRVVAVGLVTVGLAGLCAWIVMPGQSELQLDALISAGQLSGPDLAAGNQSMVAGLGRWGADVAGVQWVAVAITALAVWVAGRWWRTHPRIALGMMLVVSTWPGEVSSTWSLAGVVVLGAGLAREQFGPMADRDPIPAWMMAGLLVWVAWVALGVPVALWGSGVPSGLAVVVTGLGPLIGAAVMAMASFHQPARQGLVVRV